MLWVGLARSLWHGPNQEGRMAVELLTPPPGHAFKATADIAALRGPDVATELGLLRVLGSPAAASLPMLHDLIGNGPAPGHEPQAAGEGTGVPRVCLVHGPFGSGKSTLLVTLLRFLLKARGVAGGPLAGARILVASGTNVAVDRVLLGLLDAGCSDFLRVGSVRRMDARLLPHSLHASSSKTSGLAELKRALQETTDGGDRQALREEIARLEAGADEARKKLLTSVPIVGLTCCAALLPALDGQKFEVTVLDECSQLIEPLALAPAIRAQSRYMVAVGDPLQLPPIVAAPALPTREGPIADAAAEPHGLARPMFVRLQAAGHAVHLLRRQYRCHPDISRIPNDCFYGGRLLDGCTAQQRASLFQERLAPVVWVDPGGQEEGAAGSVRNRREAEAIRNIVGTLLSSGSVTRSQIGIICFFRAQVWTTGMRALVAVQLLQQLLEAPDAEEAASATQDGGVEQGLKIATVDAFQARERDVIVLSTSATQPSAFVGDAQRLNVALTRARRHLILVGSAAGLGRAAPAFQRLLASCRAQTRALFFGAAPALLAGDQGDGQEAPAGARGACDALDDDDDEWTYADEAACG
ncbi:hypothetical protein QBZ16_001109 [Prototheca wickerhamii]|uniref:Uncharacterized protein n=1 Tax=Prototheca wickerhamii TaxID=3111 RepID=A0AAD9IH68_PROWI|nr:hypothetical protein QBZ16_001109 [Prototheca wickerhamii]